MFALFCTQWISQEETHVLKLIAEKVILFYMQYVQTLLLYV